MLNHNQLLHESLRPCPLPSLALLQPTLLVRRFSTGCPFVMRGIILIPFAADSVRVTASYGGKRVMCRVQLNWPQAALLQLVRARVNLPPDTPVRSYLVWVALRELCLVMPWLLLFRVKFASRACLLGQQNTSCFALVSLYHCQPTRVLPLELFSHDVLCRFDWCSLRRVR